MQFYPEMVKKESGKAKLAGLILLNYECKKRIFEW